MPVDLAVLLAERRGLQRDAKLSWRADPEQSLSDTVLRVRANGGGRTGAEAAAADAVAEYHCHRHVLAIGQRDAPPVRTHTRRSEAPLELGLQLARAPNDAIAATARRAHWSNWPGTGARGRLPLCARGGTAVPPLIISARPKIPQKPRHPAVDRYCPRSAHSHRRLKHVARPALLTILCQPVPGGLR